MYGTYACPAPCGPTLDRNGTSTAESMPSSTETGASGDDSPVPWTPRTYRGGHCGPSGDSPSSGCAAADPAAVTTAAANTLDIPRNSAERIGRACTFDIMDESPGWNSVCAAECGLSRGLLGVRTVQWVFQSGGKQFRRPGPRIQGRSDVATSSSRSAADIPAQGSTTSDLHASSRNELSWIETQRPRNPTHTGRLPSGLPAHEWHRQLFDAAGILDRKHFLHMARSGVVCAAMLNRATHTTLWITVSEASRPFAAER
ncbi:hypothetical protein J2W56_006805 [Nocardia kruczakiae]|uniref:Uncharacterized protein n=1 Tax=Nocardia kruczakiae TaxID=261477 RepID=A0ABU1XR45_9NOCA|nr:hypothetical protein [Nocardia kruczakiae]